MAVYADGKLCTMARCILTHLTLCPILLFTEKKNNQNTHKHTKLLSLTLKTFFLLNEQKKNENEIKDLNDN